MNPPRSLARYLCLSFVLGGWACDCDDGGSPGEPTRPTAQGEGDEGEVEAGFAPPLLPFEGGLHFTRLGPGDYAFAKDDGVTLGKVKVLGDRIGVEDPAGEVIATIEPEGEEAFRVLDGAGKTALRFSAGPTVEITKGEGALVGKVPRDALLRSYFRLPGLTIPTAVALHAQLYREP